MLYQYLNSSVVILLYQYLDSSVVTVDLLPRSVHSTLVFVLGMRPVHNIPEYQNNQDTNYQQDDNYRRSIIVVIMVSTSRGRSGGGSCKEVWGKCVPLFSKVWFFLFFIEYQWWTCVFESNDVFRCLPVATPGWEISTNYVSIKIVFVIQVFNHDLIQIIEIVLHWPRFAH